jgi:hypothetical protein
MFREGWDISQEEHKLRVLDLRQEMTGADRQWAAQYEVGDVVRYTRGSKVLGIEPGEYARVENVDTKMMPRSCCDSPSRPMSPMVRRTVLKLAVQRKRPLHRAGGFDAHYHPTFYACVKLAYYTPFVAKCLLCELAGFVVHHGYGLLSCMQIAFHIYPRRSAPGCCGWSRRSRNQDAHAHGC